MSISNNLSKTHHQEALLLYAFASIFLALGDRRFKNRPLTLQGNTGKYALTCFGVFFVRWLRKQISLNK